MDIVGVIFQVIYEGVLWIWLGITASFIVFVIYVYYVKDWIDYRRAKVEIVSYVKSYKHKCTGNNRFVVTVETLQDSFREYETNIITKVWLDLVHERLIEQDIQDSVWCIR